VVICRLFVGFQSRSSDVLRLREGGLAAFEEVGKLLSISLPVASFGQVFLARASLRFILVALRRR
jgi:hypothetical protein